MSDSKTLEEKDRRHKNVVDAFKAAQEGGKAGLAEFLLRKEKEYKERQKSTQKIDQPEGESRD